MWSFKPEHAPHSGGWWEAAVKGFKLHLRRIIGGVCFTFEQLAITLVQTEACLNSRPLTAIPDLDEGIQVLKPGHFLIGGPLEVQPNLPASVCLILLLQPWNLCQAPTHHLWKCWLAEYLDQL